MTPKEAREGMKKMAVEMHDKAVECLDAAEMCQNACEALEYMASHVSDEKIVEKYEKCLAAETQQDLSVN